jgi:glycerol-3-phosphate O-acyltransferase
MKSIELELNDKTLEIIAKMRAELLLIEEECRQNGLPHPKRPFDIEDDAAFVMEFFRYGINTFSEQRKASLKMGQIMGEILSKAGVRSKEEVLKILEVEECDNPHCPVHHPPEPLAPRGGAPRRRGGN